MFGMATLSLDLRERILSAYDKGDGIETKSLVDFAFPRAWSRS